jgi:hypothetical protein
MDRRCSLVPRNVLQLAVLLHKPEQDMTGVRFAVEVDNFRTGN